MTVHKYSAVNPLVNPVADGDRIISETGQVLIVRQGLSGYWLQYADGFDLTRPCGNDQIAICRQIDDLANI